jgi:arsenate reductase
MNVLFVCVHNAGRSQMAEAYVNHLARERGVEIRAVAVQVMAEDGVSMEGQTPKLLSKEMIARADKVISMGCGVDASACPANFILTEDWALDDPAGQPIEAVRRIRDQIKNRVLALLTAKKM